MAARRQKNMKFSKLLFDICMKFEDNGYVTEEELVIAKTHLPQPEHCDTMFEITREVYREFYISNSERN